MVVTPYSRFDLMRRMTARPDTLTSTQPGPGAAAPPAARDRELGRLRTEAEIRARAALARRRDAARSGDLGALEAAQLDTFQARNDLMDRGLAATGREAPSPMVEADLQNRRRALALQRRGTAENLSDTETGFNLRGMERGRVTDVQRTAGELAATDLGVAQGVRQGTIDTATRTANLEALQAGGNLADEQYRQRVLTPLERSKLKAGAQIGAEATQGALSDLRYDRSTLNPIAREGALAKTTAATENAQGNLEDDRFFRRDLTPLERRRLFATGTQAAESAQESLDTFRATGDARQAAAIDDATANAIVAQTRARVAAGAMDATVGEAVIRAATARDSAALEQLNVHTATDVANATAPELVQQAKTDAQTGTIEAENRQIGAMQQKTATMLGDSPTSGIVRQLDLSDPNNPHATAVQDLHALRAVFDADNAGQATYRQMDAANVPERVNQVANMVARYEEDMRSGNPERIATARRLAQELQDNLPVQRADGGYAAVDEPVSRFVAAGLAPFLGAPLAASIVSGTGEASREANKSAAETMTDLSARLAKITGKRSPRLRK